MVRPKKHLGQHFLTDENLSLKIVEAISTRDFSMILEVGPGTGVLTRHLIEKALPFRALDVDAESIEFLKKQYPEMQDAFELQDFLKVPIEGSSVVILGNFPYNISSQLFFKIWENKNRIVEVVCMVQKEVAQRIASPHGNKTYGILSVLLQSYFDIEYLFTVKPGAFNPPPKVDSGVIRLRRNDLVELPCHANELKRVVKTAFGKRRKTLRNALKELALPAELTQREIFDQRPEQLSVDQFIELTCEIEKWKAHPPSN